MKPSIALKGQLDFVSLAQVIQFLSSNSSNGALVLRSPYINQPGVICFNKGIITNAFCGDLQGIDAAYSLFGWTEGEFEFDVNRVEAERVITQSLMEIIMEGARMLDEGRIQELGAESRDIAKPFRPHLEEGVNFIPSPDVDYSYVVEEEIFSPGQNIVEEGNHGNWICVILDGYADVIKDTKRGPFTLCRIGPGALIGDIAIVLKKENVRRASVISVDEVTLGVLDLERIHRELALMSRNLRGVLLGLNRRLAEVNHNLSRLYVSDTTYDIKSLNGRDVFDFNGSDKLFTITQGWASLVAKGQKGYVKVAEMEHGDFVGRVPFLDLGHEPGQAVLLPSEDFAVEELPTEDIVAEYENSSNMIQCIASYISNCVAATTMQIRGTGKTE
ncbi:Cyclic nucleotide-binding domain-containing protein [Desulfatibacillum alkenivorans DSM 16219]|jgi:CRP-like cAMP-binding protein|uniref:Cyclic nucleotide-binding domain-containing protein n=1 Tax=Desulfatibacillum alkenivorans DSM 16219 TaxID=1121393 RepID=A0A1M6VJ71_9BACT|nr:DUF4388 domain-containing protein [Desulfatibacillum alkenivorans]SHK81553.1 Cyclic nucleotide-binding domain-containing protein [Desulfatibacillum alkenivorans DSM 16219]